MRLTLNNTRAGQGYQIWSLTNLSLTNWVVATNFTGATGSLTQVLLPTTNRPIAFFRASGTNESIYTVDTNATFLGLNFDDTGAFVPDSMGAVGPNHFIELLNCQDPSRTAIAIYDKAGHLLAKTNTHDFFRTDATHPTTTDRLTDQRILYDHHAQRWIACTLDVAGSRDVMLAVSTTDSPTNFTTGWNRYLIPVSRTNTQSDLPTLGLDDNGVYVTILHQEGNNNGGHTVVAIKKPEIYQGNLISTRLEIYTSNSLSVWTIQPAVNFDAVPTNGYAWLVAKGPPDLGTNYQGGALCYRRMQWSGSNVVLVDTNWVVVTNDGPTYRNYYDLDGTNVTVVAGAGEVSAPHPFGGPGERITLHLGGSRLAMPVIRQGFLWTCQAVGLNGTNGVYVGDVNDTNVTRSGLQWLKMEVDAPGGALHYSTHGRVYDRAATNPWYYYFPSLMVNCAGDMVMGFSGSSATNYIGAFYSLRRAGGETTEVPRVIRLGNIEFNDGARWGDYSATTLDPADDSSFWSVQQVADEAGSAVGLTDWSTVIVKIRIVP